MAGEALLEPTRTQPTRVSRWEGVTFGPGRASGVLSVWTGGRRPSLYVVREYLPGEGFEGRAFHVRRVQGRGPEPTEHYDVLVSAIVGHSTCDCPGHTYHGRCKHADALTAAVLAGDLDRQPLKPCPMCGGPASVEEAVVGYRWFVECRAAGCRATGPSRDSQELAEAAWNTRHGANRD